MNRYEIVRDVFRSSDDIATTHQMLEAGVHSRYIKTLVKTNTIARIKRGVYEWIADGRKDDIEIVSRVLPDAILCMDTMLHHYLYTERTPEFWHIAVDKRINRKKVKLEYPPLKVHFIDPSCLEIGLTYADVNGTKMRAYDRERTICDVIRHSSSIDPETVGKAIQAYVRDGRRDTDSLMQYARRFRIHRKVRDLIGVWL
jgi:predicted transcriptional regulator of viral defense system